MVMASNSRSSAFAIVLATLVLFLSKEERLANAQLAPNYYAQSCPRAESIAQAVVRGRVGADRSLAASLLRLHFHDCFVIGCEASVLIDSTRGNTAEKDAAPNANSLRGFDVIDQIKSAVEKQCPGVVSCADILALAARDAVSFIGGPSWDVFTGRRDGRLSSAAQANRALPNHNGNLNQLLQTFKAAGLNQKDLVVLSAAHTIGVTQCARIAPRLYNFPGSKDGIDPTLNKAYAQQLRKSCPPGSANRVPMDPANNGLVFDTNYYANLFNNKGLFVSDGSLMASPSTRSQVATELGNTGKFFSDFGNAMEKMGRTALLTNASPFTGEIRLNCHRVNGPSKIIPSTKVKTTKNSKVVKKKAARKARRKTSTSRKN